ncbi:SDR family NAD(P)-dependent oxidoreductase [Pseudonocardia sp. TRM90224]|uniref:SDR family NAD(P)-dependent oxidoreductase n=1 Tax=Pseudonocardia sp. TRM90224 TaxID=2812678 RepID=UPI001E391AC8|nr:SDR family NAD(P)-dependent oxidoreductase [Pseudonocardia sp. TRM90224]
MLRDHALPDLSGSTVVVTGASGGIGAGVAARFADAGAAVVVHHHRSAAAAAEVVEGIGRRGGRAVAAQADVTDPAACAAVMDVAVERFGRLDAVVAAAGIQPVAELETMDVASWRAVVDTNATGSFVTVQSAAARMRAAGGSITVIASIEGSRPARSHAHYASAKAAVIMLARAGALEYGQHGIRVNTVSPGLVRRPGIEGGWPDGVASWRGAAPLGRLGEPSDIGDACVFLASPMARWVSGHDLVVDGGMSAVPAW